MEKAKARILAVDDVLDNLRLIGKILGDAGYEARLVPNGRSALVSVKTDAPDLILLDVKMPDLNGFEVCKRLKEDESVRDIPVIFLSSSNEKNDKSQCFSVGGVDYIEKPFRDDQIIERIRIHLYLRSLQAGLEKRNAELTEINKSLRKEIAERLRAEQAVKESEERFKKLLENVADPIFVHDPSGKIVMANNLAAESSGYSRRELLSMNISRLYAVPESPKVETDPSEKPSVARSASTETLFLKKDGGTFPVEIRATQVRLGREDVIVNSVRDIRIRKEVEEVRIRSKKLESIAVFAGGVANDINNLLLAISGNASFIEESLSGNAAAEKCLDEIKKAVLRADELTRKMLAFSIGGKLEKKKVSIADMITESVKCAGASAGVSYLIEMPENLHDAHLDEFQIKLAFVNLLTNANEAMPDGGKIMVRAENLELYEALEMRNSRIPPGKYVKVTVKDEGPGISPENIASIFDPFFSTKPDGPSRGSGLGLALVHSAIKKHDGFIAVESEGGAAFTVFLPTDVPKRLGIPSKEKPKTFICGKRKKILVMDDELSVARVLQRSLEKMGYETQTTLSGEEALRLFERGLQSGVPFDLVVLDLQMKRGMDGRETMERMMERDPAIKGILSSGVHDNPAMKKYKENGFCEVLEKPFDIETLKETVERVLNRFDS